MSTQVAERAISQTETAIGPRADESVLQREQYITRRVIDACLREDVRQISTGSKIVSDGEIEQYLVDWSRARAEYWLRIDGLGDFTLYVPVKKSVFMQPWKVLTPAWVKVRHGEATYEQHYSDWLLALSYRLSEHQKNYYHSYIQECDCAVAHRRVARLIFKEQQANLSAPLFGLESGWAQMSASEQLAAHLDHPLYPTARAKFGVSEKSIRQYCPEAMPEFYLNWLAVPKQLHVATVADQPKQWPTFAQVGLPATLSTTHQLVPVHPLTFSEYIWTSLESWPHRMAIHYAPKAFMLVRPTLSVRTLLLVDEPHLHIKLALPMRTLGSKNIRTIKPSTINDGYVFQQILQFIAARDERLAPLYIHCDEQRGGHVDNRSDLAWLLREYPQEVEHASPVCVAAFMAESPNGVLVIEQLAERFYKSNVLVLLTEYFTLLFRVHLRLWLVYGITLEANQQNCLVLFREGAAPKLLLRDNDSGRILASRLVQAHPELQEKITQFEDKRMFVSDDVDLLKMFTTINLQLNITCIINTLGNKNIADEQSLYALLCEIFTKSMAELSAEGVDTEYAESQLVEAPLHYAKYLLSSGSLLSKRESGAASINKYYGLSAINPFKVHFDNV